MFTYVIRRLLYTIPVLLGVAFVTFVLFNVVGGDPTDKRAGKLATAEQKAKLRHQLGFDKPLWPQFGELAKGDAKGFADNQFFHHFRRTFTFDFGRSLEYKRKISDMILSGAVPSLSITVPSFIIGLFLEITIAMICAFHRGRWPDRLIVILSLVGLSFPYLALIIFGQYYLAYQMHWYPIFGYPPLFGPSVIMYVALPVLLGVIAGLGGGVRLYRTIVLDETNADYVRSARAKGVGEITVMFKHVLKNAMIPVITSVVVSIPFLVLGSLLLERFFSIPGLGYMEVDAISSQDWPVVNAITFVGALIYVVALVITDICYALVDPRITLR